MDLDEALRGRRSVRRFEPSSLTRDMLLELTEGACWAPTASNMQAWRFVIITDATRLRKIRMVAPGLMGTPPAVIAVCEDLDEAKKLGPGGVDLSRMDASMAAFAIALKAYSQRLGSCIVASFNVPAVQLLLHLPQAIVPVLLVSVGRSAAKPKAPPRRTQGIVHFETYIG